VKFCESALLALSRLYELSAADNGIRRSAILCVRKPLFYYGRVTDNLAFSPRLRQLVPAVTHHVSTAAKLGIGSFTVEPCAALEAALRG
jgi:hypothetical protein